MKINLPLMMVGAASLLVALAGCSRKSDASTELDKAAVIMDQQAPAQVAAPQPVQVAQPAQPEPVQEAAPAPAPPPAQEMKQAVAAYKSGNLQDAIARLQKLRATPVMSPQQRIAVNDAVAAVMTEIYSMADKGDARAIAAVKQYEDLQSKPR
ncbi:MAG: hypothetical protein NT154_29625 [Verrucomicrobia bacterium]|nr:hypothetical protein [Verrucomicrobiota bacterium]